MSHPYLPAVIDLVRQAVAHCAARLGRTPTGGR